MTERPVAGVGNVVRIRYCRADDILTLEPSDTGRIDHADQVESIILHVDEANRPVLVEILHASDFLANVLRTSLRAEEVTA
jgi:hypothetical protein